MRENRHSGHTITHLTAHVVWVTKYRYHVLQGYIKLRCRDLLVQICDGEDVRILKGVVSRDHVHMYIEYRPSTSLSDLVKRMKGRTSRHLQEEDPNLRKQYWGRHFWAIGYRAWSTGNITEEVVQEYLEHQRGIHLIRKATRSYWNEPDFQSLCNLCTFSALWFSHPFRHGPRLRTPKTRQDRVPYRFTKTGAIKREWKRIARLNCDTIPKMEIIGIFFGIVSVQEGDQIA